MKQLTDFIQQEAHIRASSRMDKKSETYMTSNPHLLGLAGELAFGKLFGILPDLTLREYGDGGVDFEIIIADYVRTGSADILVGSRLLGVDVKTRARASPDYMLHKVGLPITDIYVLAGYDSRTSTANLLAWCTGEKVAVSKTQPSRAVGVDNYVVPIGEMETDISKLTDRVVAIKGGSNGIFFNRPGIALCLQHLAPGGIFDGQAG